MSCPATAFWRVAVTLLLPAALAWAIASATSASADLASSGRALAVTLGAGAFAACLIGPWRSALLATSLSISALLLPASALALAGVALPPGALEAAASLSALSAHTLAGSLAPPDHAICRRSLVAHNRFASLLALGSVALGVPPLALAVIIDLELLPFSGLSVSAAALTALLHGATAPNRPAEPTFRQDSLRLQFGRRTRRVEQIAGLAILAAAVAWHGRSGVGAPIGLAGLALVLVGSAVATLTAVANLPVALSIAVPPMLSVTAVCLLVSPSTAALVAMVSATTMAGGTAQLFVLVLTRPGKSERDIARTLSVTVRADLCVALAAAIVATLASEGALVLGALASSLAAIATLLPLVDAVVLRRLLAAPPEDTFQPTLPGSVEHTTRFQRRFRRLAPWIRFHAEGKLSFDPVFAVLGDVTPTSGRVLDLGAGYGLTAAWLTTARPALRVTCVEISPSRAALARHVAGPRSTVFVADVEDVARVNAPGWAHPAYDAILLIDVIHHIDDIGRLFCAIRPLLAPGGRLLVRASVAESGNGEPVSQRWERLIVRMRGQRVVHFRTEEQVTAALREAGFSSVTRSGTEARREALFIGSSRSEV